MKKITILLGFILVLFLTQCGPTTEQARQYNDKLIAEELSVMNTINAVDNAFATYKPELIESAIKKALKQIEISSEAVKKIGDFAENSKFKDETLNLFNLFKKQLKSEYAEQLELYKLSDSEYTKKEENRFNELQTRLDEEYTKVFNEFSETQDSFAAKWGFVLESQ